MTEKVSMDEYYFLAASLLALKAERKASLGIEIILNLLLNKGLCTQEDITKTTELVMSNSDEIQYLDDEIAQISEAIINIDQESFERKTISGIINRILKGEQVSREDREYVLQLMKEELYNHGLI